MCLSYRICSRKSSRPRTQDACGYIGITNSTSQRSCPEPPSVTNISCMSCGRLSARARDGQEIFHDLLVAWRASQVGEATWEPYFVMAVDVPEVVTKFMESHNDRTWSGRCDLFESSHGQLLCCAYDETSVVIMC
jgi:hypothetical protein